MVDRLHRFRPGNPGGNFSIAGGGLLNVRGEKGYQMVLGGVEPLNKTTAATAVKAPPGFVLAGSEY
ncbi:MAG: hypothetical protein KBE72_01015 [Syntrophaceae bacterium]|jgi:hypothetical protein|nr:hypothetical protein [Syntrophaceae bacterium]MBP9650008.1 hypothetical protein [Syntrophaceae bacterium]